MIHVFYPESIYKLLEALSKHKVYVVGGFVRDMLLSGRGGVILGKSERYAARSGSTQTEDPLTSCFFDTAYCAQNYPNRYLGTTNGSSIAGLVLRQAATSSLVEDDARCMLKDIDLVTADPLEAFLPTVQGLSERYHVMNYYEAIQFSFKGYQVTLTRLRYDAVCDGRQAEVIFVKTLQEDMWRRDFTINALYADAEGEVIDFLGGYQDLAQKKVRFIGDPETRIQEDVLRILRYVRFCSLLEVEMDPQLLDMFRPYLPKLELIPRDRVQQEIKKTKRLTCGAENLQKLFRGEYDQNLLPSA